jgi:hypothetical protein
LSIAKENLYFLFTSSPFYVIIVTKSENGEDMKIYSIYDKEFRSYGQVVSGIDETVKEILEGLSKIPTPKKVTYVAKEPLLQSLGAERTVSDNLFGGMPIQLGFCAGYNTKLNCLEYHRDSEFNLGVEDFILLLARQDEIVSGSIDSSKVRAFRVPRGVMVECFATTLHYAPCHTDPKKGFKVLVALPLGTNTDKPEIIERTPEDKLLLARNKWLIAHKDSSEANEGAYVGISGENIDISDYI